MYVSKKIAADVTLESSPFKSMQNADKIPISSPFPCTMFKEPGSVGLRTQGENLLH